MYLHVVPSGTNIFLTLLFYQHVVPSGTGRTNIYCYNKSIYLKSSKPAVRNLGRRR
ncbi:MAG: hypothetical protein LBP59_15200 [Planctomycetaceae bacterium]|nr:hypothetical protein [Planctomycetaceae bacterium]